MLDTIYLPKLNNLRPTMDSTLLKIMEEAGELARAVLNFLPYEARFPVQGKNSEAERLLDEVSGELLDVAQTCVTMIFVLEDQYGISVDGMIEAHLAKLADKGYGYDPAQAYRICTQGNYKCLRLPRLAIDGVTLLTTVCKIQEEIGELTQFLGKRAGASGETRELAGPEILNGCAQELLDVAQCCFTMMYILAEHYGMDVEKLTASHVAKLKRKGYCA